jgi:hypothetical protein
MWDVCSGLHSHASARVLGVTRVVNPTLLHFPTLAYYSERSTGS